MWTEPTPEDVKAFASGIEQEILKRALATWPDGSPLHGHGPMVRSLLELGDEHTQERLHAEGQKAIRAAVQEYICEARAEYWIGHPEWAPWSRSMMTTMRGAL